MERVGPLGPLTEASSSEYIQRHCVMIGTRITPQFLKTDRKVTCSKMFLIPRFQLRKFMKIRWVSTLDGTIGYMRVIGRLFYACGHTEARHGSVVINHVPRAIVSVRQASLNTNL
jgi:hypothetical protein